jgi:hypothetical protein
MTAKVFYSWQSDLGEREHKQLQRRALDRACQELEQEMSIPLEVVDFGNERVGSPDFAEHLVEQIGNSAIFVADLTLTGVRPPRDGVSRLSPNPNVAKEVGIARALLGPGAVILVMNQAHGFVGLMPPDFAAYVPCLYILSDTSSDADVLKQETELAAKLEQEIRLAITAVFFSSFSEAIRPSVARVVSFLLGVKSTTDAKLFNYFGVDEIAAETGLGEEVAKEACDALTYYIKPRPGTGVKQYAATLRLCLKFDVLVNGWNPQVDAERIAGMLTNTPILQVKDTALNLGWEPRQMNVAVEQLNQWSVIDCSGNTDASSPFNVISIQPLSGVAEVARGALRRRPRRG